MTRRSDRIGYVVKRYPRYSETFIVTEILAHERAGADLEVFSLRPSYDSHFQDSISRVRAPVTYLAPPDEGLKATHLWDAMQRADAGLPDFWTKMPAARGVEMRDAYQAVELARHVRERGIEHLHAHFATSAASVARLASALSGVPFSMTAHAKDIFHQDVDHADLGRKIHDASAVITVSDFNLQFLREEFPDDGPRVHRVYNGLDLAQFPFSSPLDREPFVLAVGRLIEKKGFEDLIDACQELARRATPFSCRIVGSGELEGALRARVADCGLAARVEFMGPRPQREVIALMQQAAVFAAPCVVGSDGNRDGLPTVLLEAMAVGTPCVSTDVTGIPEVVQHDVTGLIVPQRSPTILADALQALLTQPGRGAALAARARRLIEREFDTDRNAARLRQVFEDVSASARATAGAAR